MTPEQLIEAVRKHAMTVLLPSMAEAIVKELHAYDSEHGAENGRLLRAEIKRQNKRGE